MPEFTPTFGLLALLTLFIVLAKCLRMNMADLVGTLCSDVAVAKTTRPVLLRQVNEDLRGAMPALLRIARDGATGTVAVYGVNLPNPWAARTNTQAFLGTGATGGGGAAVAADYQFQSALTYVAAANYNWMVLLDDMLEYVLESGAAAGFSVTDVGGKARLDFGKYTGSGDGATLIFDTAIDYGALTHCDAEVKVAGTLKANPADYALSNQGGVIRITFVAAPANAASNITLQLVPKKGKRIGLIYNPVISTLRAAGANQHFYDEIACKDAAWVVTAGGTVNGTDVAVLPRGK